MDVLGVDLYQYNGSAVFIEQCQNEMRIMSEYAKSHNKLYAEHPVVLFMKGTA